MFYLFDSLKEQKKYGISSSVEVQFCELPFGTKISDVVSVSNIHHWRNDSLYISDENEFMKEYGNIFDCGIYNNLKTGKVDIYGINYYEPRQIKLIIKRINERKPNEYEILLDWLKNRSCIMEFIFWEFSLFALIWYVVS